MEGFEANLRQEIQRVLSATGQVSDWLGKFPWLVSSLGEPSSPIWFIGENPSLKQVERATDPDGGRPSLQAQWWASSGDKLFRRALVEAGLKEGTISSPGGWRCYITNLVKEPDYVSARNSRRSKADVSVRRWAEVLKWQLACGQPKLVVFMGKAVGRMASDLQSCGAIQWPRTALIEHYAYVAKRPMRVVRGGRATYLGPMDAQRVEAYLASFRSLAQLATEA